MICELLNDFKEIETLAIEYINTNLNIEFGVYSNLIAFKIYLVLRLDGDVWKLSSRKIIENELSDLGSVIGRFIWVFYLSIIEKRAVLRTCPIC